LAWFAPKTSPNISFPNIAKKFAILIPAHNEEILLPKLLENIRDLKYPKTHYDVHVIADNCTDRTVAVARDYLVNVHIRQNTSLIGKGYALQWCLEKIRSVGDAYDAYIFIDADSILSPTFLEVMNSKLSSGADVVQGYYGVQDPASNWNVSLRYAALAVLHFLRPLGRSVLGGSAGLKGNGMLFRPDVLERYPWSTSVTEDIEYHMTILLNGYSAEFAPDAVVWGEMPDRFDRSHSQLDRWETGRIEMARKYVVPLIQAAWKALTKKQYRRAFRYFDAVMEHLIPPFSVVVGISILCVALDLLFVFQIGIFQTNTQYSWLIWLNILLGVSILIGQVIYIFSGLKMVNAPISIYKHLLYIPIFMLKKITQYLKILFGNKAEFWVKTTRNQE
jgi:cellulose synthase/poly-beta-1,6-N-acetylglucosamine synthase-like glycosyltransferase